MSSPHVAPRHDDSSNTVVARLARLTDGKVSIGHTEPFVILLTADADSYPRHCALSRTELEVVGRSLHAALYARRTLANLERDGAAVLVAVDQNEIVSFRLIVQRVVRRDGLAGVRFEIVGIEIDSLGVPLTPPTFAPTAALVRREQWDATDRMLAALRESPPD
jgi:hypothetical protein